MATTDSDLFVANVDDLLDHGTGRTNLTNSPDSVDYDPDWSPDGTRIAFVRHPKRVEPIRLQPPNPPDAELYVINADGTNMKQLTFNTDEGIAEAAPDWSPDGTRLAFMCKPPNRVAEICVMNVNADGTVTDRRQLTDNAVLDATPIWSPDGRKILFARDTVVPETQPPQVTPQLFVMNADGTGVTQLTAAAADRNFLASWGVLRVTGS
jgi:TolB protein